jgi:hypothetical protein
VAILLYFDTNVLCRPFDDQTIKRIQRETEAFERILEKIRAKEAAFITSDILVFEISKDYLAGQESQGINLSAFTSGLSRCNDGNVDRCKRDHKKFQAVTA